MVVVTCKLQHAFQFCKWLVKLTKWILHGYSSVGYTKVVGVNRRTLRETGRLEGSIYWRVGKRVNEVSLPKKEPLMDNESLQHYQTA